MHRKHELWPTAFGQLVSFVGAVALVVATAAGPSTAHAASATETITINARVTAKAKLTLSNNTLTFDDGASDPDSMPTILPAEGPITVTAKVRTAGTPTLTLLANGDLTDGGGNTIPISVINWTASGTGYVNGTMDSTTGRTVGSWGSSGTYVGTLNFSMDNSWNYPVADYSQTADFTLTAP